MVPQLIAKNSSCHGNPFRKQRHGGMGSVLELYNKSLHPSLDEKIQPSSQIISCSGSFYLFIFVQNRILLSMWRRGVGNTLVGRVQEAFKHTHKGWNLPSQAQVFTVCWWQGIELFEFSSSQCRSISCCEMSHGQQDNVHVSVFTLFIQWNNESWQQCSPCKNGSGCFDLFKAPIDISLIKIPITEGHGMEMRRRSFTSWYKV